MPILLLTLILILIFLAVLYLFAVWPRRSHAEQMQAFRHTRFAHRGYHCADLGVPENSMAAFRAAVERGYGIELDVHLTKDGKLAVFHDDDLYRVCGQHAAIEDLTFEELGRFRLLNTKEQIPLFTDVLSYVSGQVPLLIELKMPTRTLGICEAVYEALKNYHGAYLIQSFNTLGLRWFKLRAPEVLRGQLASRFRRKNAKDSGVLLFLVANLLTNFLGRPDFVSYKLADLPTPSVSLLRKLSKTPVAVWTLRTEKALHTGIAQYDIQIFEKSRENY